MNSLLKARRSEAYSHETFIKVCVRLTCQMSICSKSFSFFLDGDLDIATRMCQH